jgi:hypothetical protein
VPSKKYYFFWVLAIFLLAAFLVNEFRPLTYEGAEKLATAKMERFAKSEHFDIRLLNGPEPTTPPNNVPYMFEWTYKHKYGELKLDVWVAKDGYTKVIWEGDLEHLRKEFRPVTFQEAKNLATARMQSYAKDENYDLSLFKGPESITPPISIAYEFEWTYRDNEGEVKLIALVEEHGSVRITYRGD